MDCSSTTRRKLKHDQLDPQGRTSSCFRPENSTRSPVRLSSRCLTARSFGRQLFSKLGRFSLFIYGLVRVLIHFGKHLCTYKFFLGRRARCWSISSACGQSDASDASTTERNASGGISEKLPYRYEFLRDPPNQVGLCLFWTPLRFLLLTTTTFAAGTVEEWTQVDINIDVDVVDVEY